MTIESVESDQSVELPPFARLVGTLWFVVVCLWANLFGGLITIPIYIVNRIGCHITGSSRKFGMGWDWIAQVAINHIMRVTVISHPSSHPLIPSGYILANHRSWTDFAIDPLYSKATAVSRALVAGVVGLSGIQVMLDRRIVYINRGKSSAQTIAAQMDTLMRGPVHPIHPIDRIVFFPEGTRSHYTELASPADIPLRRGLLLSLYQLERDRPDPKPFQLQITSGKEDIINEKKLIVQRGRELHMIHSSPIDPSKFATDELFLTEVRRVWFECYHAVHSPPPQN
jgi:1-acyl-sn-glycerol-3-phosphate acyltransferase